jgi:hypothetical protein
MGIAAVRVFGRCMAAVLLLVLVAGVRAQNDASARAGRIAAVSGEVWLFDGDARDWVAATRNRPFAQGERLLVGAGAAAELQVGGSALTLDGDTEIEATRLDGERLQFSLARGSVGLRQHEAELAFKLELMTAEARFQPLRAGLYRIDRRGDGSGSIGSSGSSWRGLLRASTAQQVLTVEPGRRVTFLPGADGSVQHMRWSVPESDAFAAAFLREADLSGAVPAFVAPEMTGVAELARHGSWQQHPEFGWAWTPAVVAPQWAPYRFGQWVWVQPWGWTWVDAAPWGFAPFRYGHWFWWGNRWSWAPGPGRPRTVVVPMLPGVILGGRPSPPPLGWMPPRSGDFHRPGFHPPQPARPDRPQPIHPAQPLKPPIEAPETQPYRPPAAGAAPGPFHGRSVGSVPPAAPREPTMRPVSPPQPMADKPMPASIPPPTAAPPVPATARPPPAAPFKPDPQAAERQRLPESRSPGRER